jgi:hypothetical protein
VLLTVGLGGCMGDGSSDDESGGADSRIGTRIELADCGDWRRADPRERADAIETIRAYSGGPAGPPGGRGATLEDERAHELFDRQCRHDFAASFRLYKIYARAAAFQNRRPQQAP